jgi:hypothetical protein
MTPDQLPEGGRVLYRALHAIHQSNTDDDVTDMAERGIVEFFKTPSPNRWAAFTTGELHWLHWALTTLSEHITTNDARLTGLPPKPIADEGRGPEWIAEINAELKRRNAT